MNEKIISLENFAPVITDDESEIVVFEELNRQLEKDCVNNIGITGPYGSGKSSFIESFLVWRKNKNNAHNYTVTVSNELKKTEDYHVEVENKKKNLEIKIRNNDNSNSARIIKFKNNSIQSVENEKSDVLRISLGNFKTDNKHDDKEINDLENCILKQIIYSSTPEENPESSYLKVPGRRKSDKKTILERFLLGFYFIFCIIVSVVSTKYLISKITSNINSEVIIQNSTNDVSYKLTSITENLIIKRKTFLKRATIVSTLIFLISTVCAIILLYKIINIVIPYIKQVKIKVKDIEFDVNDTRNVFSIYLAEIINYFTNTQKRIVLIEDLDRFQNETIFMNLKELNFIINNYPDIKEKVKFIYLINDDIFKVENKTKFFDLIIPIVPIVEACNIGNKMILYRNTLQNSEEIADENVKKELTDEYLIKISEHIKEYRLMLHIWNEFKIYYHRLKDNPFFNVQTLFTYIVIKNTQPKINNYLGGSKNIFNSLISIKKEFVENREKEINQEIKNFWDEVNWQAEQAKEDVYKEFFYLYLEKYFPESNKSNIEEYIEKTNIKYRDIIDSLKLNIKESNTDIVIDNDKLNALKNIEDQSIGNALYFCEQSAYNPDELEFYEDELTSLLKSSYSELIISYPEQFSLEKLCSLFKIEEDKELFELIYNYIKNGIIDDYYFLGTSIFYEGALSIRDQLYINLVEHQEKSSPDYPIDYVENVIKRLLKKDHHLKILSKNKNFCILDFLIYNSISVTYMEILESYIKLFESKDLIEFFKWYDNNRTKAHKLNIIIDMLRVQFDYLDNMFEKFIADDKLYFIKDFLLAQPKSYIYIRRRSHIFEYIKQFYTNWQINKNNYTKEEQEGIEAAFTVMDLSKQS